ncbi:MAG: hypothetical protein LAO78_14465 [Acidobacteriia bacterium]|nr:hypothetical protein [Terriglobia bacterium]
MRPVTSPEPIEIDPDLELQRTQRLQELRALYDAAVTRLETAKRHQSDVQVASNQMQNELNQTQAQVPAAQQDAATKRSAADTRKARVAELRAAYDAATARLLGSVDTRQPILLLPIRLETRFMRSSLAGPVELLIRIYPDDIHIDTHEPLLTADEQRWGVFFQQQKNATDDVKKRAWRQLVERFGVRRAAWIGRISALPPTTPRTASWTRAPYSKVLPDRWVAVAYRGDQPAATVWGKDILGNDIGDFLPTGPAPVTPATPPTASNPALPAVDDGMRWMVDFAVAENAGMALRIPLTDEQAARGFERLIVVGVRNLDTTNTAALVVEMLEAQHYTQGLSLLPQNTPTNNTEAAASGFGAGERDADVAYSVEQGSPLLAATPPLTDNWLDGHWLAWALGITTATFEHIHYADGTEQRDARRTNRQLWPQDTPWLRRLLISGDAGNISDFIRDHFSSYVIARGPLPTLRVGTQPYGLLPVTAFERLCLRPRSGLEALFLQRFRSLQSVWKRAAALAPSVTRGNDLVQVMAGSGTACRYLAQDFQNNTPLPAVEVALADLVPKLLLGGNPVLLAETLDACSHRFDAWVTSLAARRLDELRRSSADGIRLGGYGWLEDVRPSPPWQTATPPAGVPGPVFQSPSNMGFVQAPSLAHATTAAILRSGYLSHLDQGDGNPFAINLSSDRVRRAEWLLQGVRQGQSLGALLGYRFERRLHENNLDQYIARFRTLAAIKQNDELANAYAQVRIKQQLYDDVKTLRDEAAQARASATAWRIEKESRQLTRQQYQNTMDVFVALQAQVQSAATASASALTAANQHRAAILQSTLHRTTINKPGFGAVEIVDSASLIEEVDVDGWKAAQAQLDAALQQARTTEANLRQRLADAKPAYDIAVQQAARLDDPNNPQSVPAAKAAEDQQTHLADGFDLQATTKEGQPGKAEQDLAAARLTLAQTITAQWQKSLVSVAANNVVDGLELRRRWSTGRQTPTRWDATTIPFGDAVLGFPASGTPDFNRLTAQLQWLDEMVDAVGDLVLAESTHHLVQGNPLRSGATLDAIAGGEIPPHEMEVIRTPRTGIGLTHRMLVLFSKAPSYPTPGWPLNATHMRAVVEPVMNTLAAQLLPDPSRTQCRIEFVNRTSGLVVGAADVALTALQISALDAVYMTQSLQGPQRAEIEERLLYFAIKTQPIPANADLRLNYDLPSTPGNFTLRQFAEVARTVRGLIGNARAIDGRDLAMPGDTANPAMDLAEVSTRVTAIQQSFNNALTTLLAAIASVRGASATSVDVLANALFPAAAFGIPGAVPVITVGNTAQTRADMLFQGDSVAREMDTRLKRIANLSLPAGSTPEAQRDYELTRLRELFGADFRIMFWITPQNAASLKTTFAASTSLQGTNPMESITWFQRAANVRNGVARLRDALEYAEALGTGAKLALQVGQLPYQNGDRWAALKGTFPPGLLSLVAHMPLPQAVTFDQPVAGLLIDEWNEMIPKAKEITGLTFHYDQPSAAPPQTMLLAVAPDDRPVWDLDTLQATLVDTLNLAKVRAFPADRRTELPWVEGRLPRGAQMSADNETWQWSTHDPTPLSTAPAHVSAILAGEHQHFFYGATETLKIAPGDTLFAYVYLDPVNPPREVMLQWNDGTWEHRAYWGENLIGWGQDGTISRRCIGALPPLGQWLRLEVPAALVGLEGRDLNGMAFTLWDGRAAWDRSGRLPAQPMSVNVADDRNETVWFDEKLPVGASLFSNADSWQWVTRDPAPRDASFIHQSNNTGAVHQHYFLLPSEVAWVDDELPAGAVPSADPIAETWQWVSQNPAPLFGSLAHQSAIVAGGHQHYFSGAAALRVAPGAMLFAHVYLDPANPPREVMLQWNDGSWEHRAYWGENMIAWGTAGTISRYFMGPLPQPGQWVRLEVPARLVGLENHDINGMAFTLWDGRATWDHAGITPQQSAFNVGKGDVLYADVYLDVVNTPATVMLQWNDGSWEHRAYWGANNIPYGVDQSPSRRPMGALPMAGQWVRLTVPARLVGLEGREVKGMAFSLSNGRASWNRAGTISAPLSPSLVFAAGVI